MRHFFFVIWEFLKGLFGEKPKLEQLPESRTSKMRSELRAHKKIEARRIKSRRMMIRESRRQNRGDR